jgi:hypothetical protein
MVRKDYPCLDKDNSERVLKIVDIAHMLFVVHRKCQNWDHLIPCRGPSPVFPPFFLSLPKFKNFPTYVCVPLHYHNGSKYSPCSLRPQNPLLDSQICTTGFACRLCASSKMKLHKSQAELDAMCQGSRLRKIAGAEFHVRRCVAGTKQRKEACVRWCLYKPLSLLFTLFNTHILFLVHSKSDGISPHEQLSALLLEPNHRLYYVFKDSLRKVRLRDSIILLSTRPVIRKPENS